MKHSTKSHTNPMQLSHYREHTLTLGRVTGCHYFHPGGQNESLRHPIMSGVLLEVLNTASETITDAVFYLYAV